MSDDDWDLLEDAGTATPTAAPSWPDPPGVSRETPVEDITPGAGPAEDVTDAPPAHADKRWYAGGRAGPVKVTAAVRRDVAAKIGLGIEVVGRAYGVRDPICGGAVVDNRQRMAEAWAAMVCESPDLLKWFTGPGGKFMLWLDIFAACAPVASTIVEMHVMGGHQRIAEAQAAVDAQMNGAAAADTSRYPVG